MIRDITLICDLRDKRVIRITRVKVYFKCIWQGNPRMIGLSVNNYCLSKNFLQAVSHDMPVNCLLKNAADNSKFRKFEIMR